MATNTSKGDDNMELVNLTKEQLIEKCKTLIYSNKNLKDEINGIGEGSDDWKKKSKKNHKQREFNFSKYKKQRIALKLLYIGWDYQGFASQENTTNTIEEELFIALIKSKLIENRATANYSRCGRTDKGVSAFGQVIALDVRSNMLVTTEDEVNKTEKKNTRKELPYVQIMNRLLPPDIRVVAYAPINESFDARFSCKTRVYKYFFSAAELDLSLMQEAAQKIVGEHDFLNFCKVDIGNNVNHFIRNVVLFNVRRTQDSSSAQDICEIVGLAFLWHQVRCMAAILLMIGQGLEKPSVIDYLLDVGKCPKRPQYNMASEYPLLLFDCTYESIEWIYEQGFNEPNVNRMQQLLTKNSIKTTVLRAMLGDLSGRTTLKANIVNFQMSAILPGFRNDNHKPLAKLSVCEGLDRHMEKLAAKRVKLEEKYTDSIKS